MNTAFVPMEGGCTCRFVRYRCDVAPLIVHACHCSWCQRETGTAFALNAMVEADRVQLLQGEVELVDTNSASGKGQKIARCPRCHVALWSHYPQSGTAISFLRVGSLDEPNRCPPDIHIYTSTKQAWLSLPADARAAAEFYNVPEVWPMESLKRYAQAKAKAAPPA